MMGKNIGKGERRVDDKMKLTIGLIRRAVCPADAHDPVPESLSHEQMENVLSFFQDWGNSQDLTHLIGAALQELNWPISEKWKIEFRKSLYYACARAETMEREWQEISRVLTERKIRHMALKGTVLRRYYPEPWMRTSSDIDVLVDRQNLNDATAALSEQLGYKSTYYSAYDVSLRAPSGVHVELHYKAIEEASAPRVKELLDPLLDRGVPGTSEYDRVLPDAWFYLYHMAHMAKHITSGGVGVRFFLDIWVLCHGMTFDRAEREALLEKAGLKTFADRSESLEQVWFEGKEECAFDAEYGEYVFYSGAYGSRPRAIATEAILQKSGKPAFWRKIFKPYEELIVWYPKLKVHPRLILFYQVRRWIRIVFGNPLRLYFLKRFAPQLAQKEDVHQVRRLLSQLEIGEELAAKAKQDQDP